MSWPQEDGVSVRSVNVDHGEQQLETIARRGEMHVSLSASPNNNFIRPGIINPEFKVIIAKPLNAIALFRTKADPLTQRPTSGCNSSWFEGQE